MSMFVPAGVACEPVGKEGAATLLSELVCRGAGDLDSRGHSDALDMLGVQRGTSVETSHMQIGAQMLGEKVSEALPLLLDMVRRPTLDKAELDPARDLALQCIEGLEDEPQQKVFIQLRARHFPMPFGRSHMGRKEALGKMKIKDVRDFWKRSFVPGRSVIAFAGRFDWDALKAIVEKELGDWSGDLPEPKVLSLPPRGTEHVEAPSTQVHIGLAFDAPPERDPNSILQKTAAAVLSGGMSGRLFTEVREKRGLCYSVYAAYAAGRDRGAMLAYAGTTAPRAQETLDVLAGELKRLSQGIEQSEFARAIVGMKSRVIMSGESTGARSYTIGSQQIIMGAPLTLAELAARIDAVTLDAVNQYVKANPPGPMTMVTIGPTKLALA